MNTQQDQQAWEAQIIAILNEYVTPYRYDFTTAAKHIAALQRSGGVSEGEKENWERKEKAYKEEIRRLKESLLTSRISQGKSIMNVELLEKKMNDYFDNTPPEQIAKEFDEMIAKEADLESKPSAVTDEQLQIFQDISDKIRSAGVITILPNSVLALKINELLAARKHSPATQDKK